MPHIDLPNLPGIRGPMAFRPATIQPTDPALYRERGKMVARDGYVAANLTNVVARRQATELVSK